MKPTKLLSLILAAIMALSLLAGCSGGNPAEGDKSPDTSGASSGSETPKNEDKNTGEIIELNFYISAPPSNDQERVMEKANAIIEKEIGAHLNLIFIDPGMYAEKINLMISSGEEFDLCFMANWGDMNFFENAAKGAFVPMNDLFEQYAPQDRKSTRLNSSHS